MRKLIKTYYKTRLGKLYLGKCERVLKTFSDNYFDTIVTDPPYGISFMSKKWDYDVPSVKIWKEHLRVLKPGGTLICFSGSRTQHRMAVNIEDAGFIIKDCIMWLYGQGFPKATDISKQLDKMAGADRKVVGRRILKGNAGVSTKDKGGTYIAGASLTNIKEINVTAATTKEAKLWDGWKSHGLKPAYEPIIMAVKPNEGSYAKNALRWGVAGLNIEEGRIKDSYHPSGSGARYPSNVIIDEETAKMLKGNRRFFYTAKPHPSERNKGLKKLKKIHPSKVTGRKVGSKGAKVGGAAGMTETPRQNIHPTVKPLDLMVYLCRLTKTPTGGVVLDAYLGSGTTAIACEKLGREWIGIEKDKKYCEIAKNRIEQEAKRISFFKKDIRRKTKIMKFKLK